MDNTYTPLVTDEKINDGRHLYKRLVGLNLGEDAAEAAAEGHTQGCVGIRHIYEAERRQTHAELAELRVENEKRRESLVRCLNDLQDFVDKVNRGEARSKRSYNTFKTTIEIVELNTGVTPDHPTSQPSTKDTELP